MVEERLAVVAIHGMGQQVPYQTIDDVVERLREPGAPEPVARRESINGEPMSFVETRVAGKRVDVFEAYWAPATEGRVTLRDVMRFLFAGGMNGIRNAEKGTAWRDSRGGGPNPLTALALFYVATVLVALVAMNAVIATFTARALAGLRAASPALVSDLTTVFLAVTAVLVVFAVGLAFPRRFPATRPLARLMLHVALAATVLGGLAVAALFVLHRGGRPPLMGSLLPGWLVVGTWVALALVSLVVRHFIVQYLGDVAAYVSSHKLDRFSQLRDEIRESAARVLRNVYAAKEGGAHRYAGVAIVGHSLGSVVAYESLNALLLSESMAPAPARNDVAARTRLLLTFGSPLDKTAFVFAQTAGAGGDAREALVLLKQPLLTSPESRPRAWVNVWSRDDPVSGSLDFYHGKATGEARVRNLEDPDAVTPLLAHTQYWKGALVWKVLREELARDPVEARRVEVERQVRVQGRAPAVRSSSAPV